MNVRTIVGGSDGGLSFTDEVHVGIRSAVDLKRRDPAPAVAITPVESVQDSE